MNTKKITALALAALMAAGTTSTAFAGKTDAGDKKPALVFGSTGVYESDDGVLVAGDGEYAPGDTLYFQLDENTNATAKYDDNDRKRVNVYADWKVGGDNVESIDILYKKGSEVKKVTVGDQEIEAANVAGLNAAILEAYKGNKGTVATAINNMFTEKQTGYALNGKHFTDKAGLLKELKYTSAKTYTHNGSNYAGSEADLIAVLKAEGYELANDEGSTKKFWSANGSQGYGKDLADNNTGGLNEIVDISKLYVSGSNFVDLAIVKDLKTFATAADTTLNVTITDNDNGYVNGTAVYADENEAVAAAMKADKNIIDASANHVYVDATAATTVIADSKDKAVDWAIAKTIKDASVADSNAYTYWVEVKTKKNDSTKELDVAGTLYLGTSKNKAEDAQTGSDKAVDFTLSNRNKDHYNPEIDDEATIKADENGAVKFSDDAEEVTIYFGENEDAWFTFNAKGLGALNFGYTLKFNKEIADLFPKANIDFISWNAEPATNRTGDLYITAKEDTFLYQVTEDGKGIKEVKGADYNEDEGAWHIRTRKLGSYVISDMELDTTAKVEDKDEASSNSSTSSKPNGDKHNPDTGR